MPQFWRKLARLGRRDRLARRLREELELHAELAGQEIGNRTRILEESDDVWRLRRIEALWADLRYAFRAMRRSPAFFLLAAVGSGLGVAAITCVLSVADATLIRGPRYRDTARLMIVSDQLLKLGFARFPMSVANYLDYRESNRVFDGLAAFEPRALTVVTADRAERVPGMLASANLLAVLGEPVAQGSWFAPGAKDAVVLSHTWWRTRLGGGAAVGRTLRIDDGLYTVIGVLPEGFGFRLSGDAPLLWLPAALPVDAARNVGALTSVGRLKPGVAVAAARAQMQSIAADLKQRYRTGMGPQGQDGGYSVAVEPLREELFGTARPSLYVLGGASAILMLLALSNTAMLWLGRAAARRKEAAVRLALGASRARVAQQLVTEALLPSLAGGALALILTTAALQALQAAPPRELQTIDSLVVNYRVFAFAMLLSAAAAAAFGMLPVRSLFRAGFDRQPRGEGRLSPALIAVQAGLSCALLGPALLLVENLRALERVDPGFRTQGLMTAYVSLPPSRYREPDTVAAYYRNVEARMDGTLVSRLPLEPGAGGDPFSIEGRAYGTSGSTPQFAHQMRVGRRYFDVMQVPLRSGRLFEDRDFAEATNVALVNETLAKAFWPRESPVGRRILMGAPRPGAAWMTIAGVVADIRTGELTQMPLPQIYRPYSQAPARTMALVFTGDVGPALRFADPEVPAYAVESMERHVSASIQRPRFRTQVISAYALLAFALAGFGVYSLAAWSAIRRRREFAVRAALGSTRTGLLRTMISGTVRPAAWGIAGGLAAAWAAGRAMQNLFEGVKPSGSAVYLTSAALVLVLAGLAAGLAGRRLLRIEPSETLRAD